MERNREGFLVDHLHASLAFLLLTSLGSIQRNGRRWCPSSVCWASFVTLVTLGKNPWWIWRSVFSCGYGPGPGDKRMRYHNREGIHIPGWTRKIIDSKVTTGMGHVSSQEGNFCHIIGVSDKNRYDQSSIERVVGFPSLQKKISKTIPQEGLYKIGAHPK